MSVYAELDRIAINVKSRKLLKALLKENLRLAQIMRDSKNETEALVGMRNWVLEELQDRPHTLAFCEGRHATRESFEALKWRDYAAIRILDYIDHAGREFVDLNLRGELAVSNPIKLIWLAANRGTGGAKPGFFEDTLHLFRQFSQKATRPPPARQQVDEWMERFPSGLDPRIVALREENRDRILSTIIDRIDRGKIRSSKFHFASGMSRSEKFARALEWWNDKDFHLSFAVRSPDLLNEMLGYSLDPDTMKIMYRARDVAYRSS